MSTLETLDRPARPRPGPRRPAHQAEPAVAMAGQGSAATAAAVAPLTAPARPQPRPEARPRHLRVVAPAERVRRRLSPATAVLATLMVFAVLFAVAVSQTVLVQGQGRLDDLDAQLTTEQARYQELRLAVSQLESPTRIVAAAHERGMVTPDDLVYLQPPASDLAAAEGAGEPDPAVAGVTEQSTAWSTVKPLLGEAP
jgi:cell division protein FtsL